MAWLQFQLEQFKNNFRTPVGLAREAARNIRKIQIDKQKEEDSMKIYAKSVAHLSTPEVKVSLLSTSSHKGYMVLLEDDLKKTTADIDLIIRLYQKLISKFETEVIDTEKILESVNTKEKSEQRISAKIYFQEHIEHKTNEYLELLESETKKFLAIFAGIDSLNIQLTGEASQLQDLNTRFRLNLRQDIRRDNKEVDAAKKYIKGLTTKDYGKSKNEIRSELAQFVKIFGNDRLKGELYDDIKRTCDDLNETAQLLANHMHSLHERIVALGQDHEYHKLEDLDKIANSDHPALEHPVSIMTLKTAVAKSGFGMPENSLKDIENKYASIKELYAHEINNIISKIRLLISEEERKKVKEGHTLNITEDELLRLAA